MSWKDSSDSMRLSNLINKAIGKGPFTLDTIILIRFAQAEDLSLCNWTEQVESPSGPYLHFCILLSLLTNKVE